VPEALGGLGRAALWALVPIAFGIAAGLTWRHGLQGVRGATATMLLVACAGLFAGWVLALVSRTFGLLGAIGRAVTRGRSRRL
jgi:hypothetical protein